jgi:hypothetical protein
MHGWRVAQRQPVVACPVVRLLMFANYMREFASTGA